MSESRNPSERVKIYDSRTKEITEIPANELSAGMVRISLNGSSEILWTEAKSLDATHVIRHDAFTGKRRERVEYIARSLSEVYPLSYHEWEEGFRSDLYVDEEISDWLHFARCYNDFVAWHAPTPEEKREAFAVLTSCILGTPSTASLIVERKMRNQQHAQELMHAFFSGRSSED